MIDWTYCQINFQILDDGRGASDANGLSNRQMWIRFIAQSENKTIRKSTKLPIHTSSGIPLAPDPNNLGQKQILGELINQLKWDGWEEVDRGGAEWWQVRFRQETPFQDPKKLKPKWRDLLPAVALVTAIALFGLAGLSNFDGLNPYRHYTREDLNLSAGNAPLQVDQMVLINFNSRELDPLQEMLPAELAADNPTNAKTVVWINCDTESNWRGATTDCATTVIDWSNKQILDEKLIEGEFTLHPEDEAQSEQTEYRNDQAILDYLTNLPRQ